MEELKMAQFDNNYTKSKEKTCEILKTVGIYYCIQDELLGKQEIREWSGYTSLHFAVKALALDLTNDLLEKGADLFKQGTRDGCTPLHVAMNSTFTRFQYDDRMSTEEYKDYRNEELLEYQLMNTLLSKQVDMKNTLNLKNKHGVSHLHIACIIDHAEAVKFFAKTNISLDQPINYDSIYDPHDYMEIKQFQGYTPLHCAVKYSSVKAAEMLLQHGADIHFANGKGMSCVHLLIERKMLMTDFITRGKRTLCMPCVEEIEKIESIIKLVLKTRAADDIFVDKIGLSAFHLACTLGDRTMIECYLQRQADVNMRVKSESEFWPGWTPLHFAACFHIETMILLIQNGAEISIENSNGETALDLCAKRFTPVHVQLILSMNNDSKEIVLSDNRTKLSDLLLAMNDYDKFKNFLQNLENVNLQIPFISPIWAGYSLLHLSVSLNEKAIDCKNTIRFELPEARNNDVERYNCTEEEETLYWKRIELCLECGCSVNIKNAKGQTPIHLAFKMLKEETTKELLKRSEDNIVDEENLSHLHIACAVGDLKAVKRYLTRGANVNSRVKKSFDWHKRNWQRNETTTSLRVDSTPLHVAVMFEHKDLVEYLLSNSNANVYAKDSQGLTPIHLTISRDGRWASRQLTRLMLKKISNLRDSVSKDGLTLLHVAVLAEDEKAVKRLLLKGAEIERVVDANVKQPPFLADLAGKTPLHIAVGNSAKVVEILLKHGANVHAKDPKGVSVLQHLIRDIDGAWSVPMIRELKKGNYDVETSDGVTLLHFACGDYDLKWAKKLLKNGADVNARISAEGDLYGATPLHMLFIPISIYDANTDVVVSLTKLLLDNGADVTIECCGCTVLHWIYQKLYNFEDFYLGEEYEIESVPRCVDLILENQKSYNVNPIDRRGFSHFHFACVRNNEETVKKFLDHGIDVNQSIDPFAKDIGGFTPLHFAMAYESEDVAYLLLERGADVKAKDAYGNEPLQVGIKRKFVDLQLIDTMISYGADLHTENLSGETLLDCLLTYGGLTLERLEFFFSHGCFVNIMDIRKGILGSAMLSAAPNDFLPILKRITQICEVKNAIQAGYNVIQSIVAVKHEGELTVDNYLSSIEFLMSIGCELDQQDEEGTTALHKAASYCNLEAIDALLQLGADVNILNYANECPFSDKVVATENISLDDSRRTDFDKLLFSHILKMKVTRLDVNDENFKYIIKCETRNISVDTSLVKVYLDELKKAKETEIVQNLAVGDFLSELGAVRKYPRFYPELKVEVDKFFNCTVDLRREFPEFSGLLTLQFRKACNRKELLQPAGEAIIAICQVCFPDLCLEAMLDFFTNGDLKIVIALVEDLFK